MSNIDVLSQLIIDNTAAAQTLDRVPEPAEVMSSEGSVVDFDAMMASNLTANYAVCLDLVARTRKKSACGPVLDLCCGPGNLSLCFLQHLDCQTLKGLDLSGGMINKAVKNARLGGYSDRASFVRQSATELSEEPDGYYDLVSLTNSAHHLTDLKTIGFILGQAERLASRQGTIFLADLARLKTETITRHFVEVVGADYGDFVRQDFLNSMMAAWLPSELERAVPKGTERTWYSIALGGLPFFQALIGLPVGRRELFVNPGVDWVKRGFFPDEGAKQTWQFMNSCLQQATVVAVKSDGTYPVHTAS